MQNHRKDYAFGQVYPLIAYANLLLPFQVVLSGGTAVSKVFIHDLNSGAKKDITDSMKQNGLAISEVSGFKILRYDAYLPVVGIANEGFHYLSITITELGTIYSDVMSLTNRVDDYLLLEYSNPYDFELKDGVVDFSGAFKFKCYLPTQIGKPEYVFEEEATERMGYTFIESQVSKKVYKFTFVAPEYLCDALRIVRMCQCKTISGKLQTYDLSTFNMEPEWEEQGDLAVVNCEFETDTVASNIGGYELVLKGGDFNADFNSDFLISDK